MLATIAAKLAPVTLKVVGNNSTAWTHMINQATLLTVLAAIAKTVTTTP